jgi:hypothetical protein
MSTGLGQTSAGGVPKVRASDKQWTKRDTNYLQTGTPWFAWLVCLLAEQLLLAVDEFDPKQPMTVLRNKMLGLVERLADPEDKFEALLMLHTYLTRLYAESGRKGVLTAARQAKTGQAISESPRCLARILRVRGWRMDQ